MVDFEKIGDTFEEGFDKVKDFTKKNKVLTIAIIGVGAFALYKLFSEKMTSEDTEYVSTYAYVPTAYDGYPTMSESVSYDDVVDQLRNETSDINKQFYDETMSDISQMIEKSQYETNKKIDDIIESRSTYGDNLTSLSYLEEQRERQKIIDKMSANSEAWYTASDSERERLHEENVALGSLLGASFDSASGTWTQDGATLYNVPVKNKTNTSTAALTNVGVTETPVSRTEVIAQMKTNSEAWLTASETERKKLEAENQQLGKSIGASYDSSTGVWTNSNGGALYTVGTSSSKTSVKKTSSTSTNTSTVVNQMKANSQAWHNASESERKNLAAKNQELGKSIGATFDSASGTWSKNGTKLY